MFVYFLQKKEFINNDPNYLKNCLRKVQALKGENKFYSFYRDYLLELFFNRLDRSEGKVEDPAIIEILGDVPYVNGGVFGQSDSEREFKIDIPDAAFQEIFNFFDSYSWHLDTRPTGIPNEINPEVIGYIFEQYINFTAEGKKENGAYYTKHDVTGYMVTQSLLPRIFDEVLSLGVDVGRILQASPLKYMSESMRYGMVGDSGEWARPPRILEECWLKDPLEWGLLDSTSTDPELCLPDETWVEMFYRRERVSSLKLLIEGDPELSANKLVTWNINSLALLIDVLGSIESTELVESLWSRISELSVIDPTCGSGAFLFAALEILEDIYASLAGRLQELNSRLSLLDEMTQHPNKRYFFRKHAALRNLYGTDIMPDAIETAKLRVFLALASCLESKDQIEPLPDLDFNIRVGNLVVGFKDADDAARVDLGMLRIGNPLGSLQDNLDGHLRLHANFLNASSQNLNLSVAKKELTQSYLQMKDLSDRFYAECVGKTPDAFEDWARESKPFHWIIEFPQVFSNGGFDVIIGNPPYINRKNLTGDQIKELSGYACYPFEDLYLVCLERSLSLLHPRGRMSFIVMLSLSFGETGEAIRGLISKMGFEEWWSTFGQRPKGLFSGAGVRNTILALGPGSRQFTTHHHIFNDSVRTWLFECLEYSECDRKGSSAPVRSGVAQNLGELISQLSLPDFKNDGEEIFFRPSANYWLPVFPSRPPALDLEGLEIGEDSRVKSLRLDSREGKTKVVAVLGGKIGYFYWSSIGDDFDVNARELLGPRRLLFELPEDAKLSDAAAGVMNKIKHVTVANARSGKMYLNIRYASMREATDVFDRLVLEAIGQIQEWKSLNIWYRQSMRANDSKAKSGLISEKRADSLWGLGI
jgi:type I restriction-modification system DNA methylase subunit